MDTSERQTASIAELYLIHDGTLEVQRLRELVQGQKLVDVDWSLRETVPPQSRVLLFLGDEQVRDLILLAVERQWEVGLLAHREAGRAIRTWGVSGGIEQLTRYYTQVEAIDADVLTCNDQVVLSSVVIGEVLALEPYDAARPPTRRSMFKAAMQAIKSLSLNSYSLIIGKEHKIRLAALGLVVMEQTQSSLVGRSFSEMLSISDGRLTMLLFAPRSVTAYFWFLIRLLLPGNISLSRLPASVGLIISDRIVLESSRGLDYSLDGKPVSAKGIEFRSKEQRLRLLPGPALSVGADQGRKKDKDTVRLQRLPVEEEARQFLTKPLPLFNHASEAEHRDLFVALRDNASLSSSYLVLTVLSVLLALTGLYANSAPVIIGAMILAPLMAPIISFAMGLARTEATLIRNSMQTLGAGIGLGLICAITVAWIMPLDQLTPEMSGRVSPTLLDLSVAIISGIAGAYAHAKEGITKSLAGVAIAVALVPPLSVAGVGVGWGDWSIARGAFLLFTTNLVGIAMAASLTFLVMGFAPFGLARKGLAITFVLVAIIIGPLYVAFVDLVEQGRILRQIPTGQVMLIDQPVNLRVVKVRNGTPPFVRVAMSSSRQLNESHVDALKQLISDHIGRPVVLEAQLNLRR